MPDVLAYLPSPSQGVWHLGPVPLRAYALAIITGVVLAVVDVLLEDAAGGDLDDPEGEARRVGGPREELDVAVVMALARRDDDRSAHRRERYAGCVADATDAGADRREA